MSKVCFLDNDILVKLVVCDLFDEAIATLGVKQSDLMVLPSARHYFKNSRSAKKRYPENIRLQVTEIANNCQTINRSEKSVLEEVSILQQYENIDDGEATIVAATKCEESFWLTTGDKRFLRALASSSELDFIVSRLKGRIICLEQLVFSVIIKQGFQKTLTSIISNDDARQYDTALKSIFGSGEKSTENSVISSLKYYIEDLRKDTKGMLSNL